MPPSQPDLFVLNRRVEACRKCPRLIAHCRAVAREKRAAYRNQTYHGRPVPNFLAGRSAENAARARLLVVGLAPGAHGANRTGRMFTGDRSGQFLYRSMHHAGLCNQPTCTDANDGLKLHRTVVTAAVHCAPPANKPNAKEIDTCSGYLADTCAALPDLRVIVSLGKIAHDAVLRLYRGQGWIEKLSAYPFSHGAAFSFDPDESSKRKRTPTILCAYHPSQQNTFTGRLTERMLNDVFRRAAALME